MFSIREQWVECIVKMHVTPFCIAGLLAVSPCCYCECNFTGVQPKHVSIGEEGGMTNILELIVKRNKTLES